MRPRSIDYGLPLPEEISTIDLSGRCVGNSYLLIEPIGGGATGTVWRALDRGTGAQVAVKLLREELMTQPKAVTRFVQERAILLMLHHENIVRVRDLLAVGDSLGLVMDLVPGGCLREHLRHHGTLPAPAAAGILAQIAAALAEAHGLGVVHRDLKPDNILLDRVPEKTADEPHVRLTDFGIARVLDAAGLTTPEALIGTPNYLAPEIINGCRPTPAADVYAMGILLYELIAGRPPYAGGPPVTVLRRHLECTPHRYDGIPDEVWQVILACTDKNPEQRPSAASLKTTMRSLARLTVGTPCLPPSAAPPFPATPTPSPRSGDAAPRGSQRSSGGPPARRWTLALVLSVVSAALAAGISAVPGWNLLRDGNRPPGAVQDAPAQAAPASPAVPTRRPTAKPSPTGAPAGVAPVRLPEVGPVTVRPIVPPLPLNPGAFGPLQCPEAYVWDPGHPARVRPCHATGPAIRLVGQMQALPGVQADISLSLQDAETGETVGGPVTCRAVMFTDFAPEHSCGPFDFAAVRGRRYVMVQSWQYTGRQLLPGGTAHSDPFTW